MSKGNYILLAVWAAVMLLIAWRIEFPIARFINFWMPNTCHRDKFRLAVKIYRIISIFAVAFILTGTAISAIIHR